MAKIAAGDRPRGHYLWACAPDEELEVTLVLRRRRPLERPHTPLAHPEFVERYGADPVDIGRLRALARQHGLVEVAADPARRVLRWRGKAGTLQQLFGVELGRYEVTPGGASVLGCSREPRSPDPAVVAVLGLERRPVARPHFRRPRSTPEATFTPIEIGKLYRFPPGDGTGQSIAIIELGGGYQTSDIDAYFGELRITTPTIVSVGVDGSANQPGSEADAEVTLDIEIAGALVPAAAFTVYFAPNTEEGFYDAVSRAVHDTNRPANVLSISWGGPENGWSGAARSALESALEDAAALGVSVSVAAGDSGSDAGENDGPHVDFPASSPSVLACGGTKLTATASSIASEVVWNETAAGEGATGGGVSAVFARPTWQSDANVPATPAGFAGRGVPDVAGNADPLTGYRVLIDGQASVVGGTSAVAPLWAALIARLNQRLGESLGFVNDIFYGPAHTSFRDITTGNNGAYRAGPGWDPCTGWGSPNGEALLAALAAAKNGTNSD